MTLLEKVRGLFRPALPSPRGATVVRPASRYMDGNRGPLWTKWRPSIREPRDEVEASWTDATARTLDLLHNLGWISGAIEQATANTVGVGLRLDAKPDAKALGMGPASAKKWAKMVEQRFAIYANTAFEVDIEGRQTFGQMQAQAFKSYLATGEVLAEHVWRDRPGSTNRGKVRVLPSRRLAPGRTNMLQRLWQGVYCDSDGLPVGYLFEYPDIVTGQGVILRRIDARDPYGRKLVSHVFDGMPGQVRGLTPLVPVLRTAKRFDELADATLMSAIIQSVFAATLTTTMPTQEAMEGLLSSAELAKAAANGEAPIDAYLKAEAAWHDNVQFDTSLNGRIANLFPGQELKFLTPGSPTNNYKEFATHLLREIARCLGATYESMTGDYAGVTFSSVRMATDEIFRIVTARRKTIIAPFCQDVYANWLEEEIDAGRIPLPGGIEQYLGNRTAIANAEWAGSPKPQADDLKTAKAHQTLRDMGVVSDRMICSDYGRDVEDVYAEIADEIKARKKLGIPETFIPGQKAEDRDIKEMLAAKEPGAPAEEGANGGG
jgi:lambda family phage portal protein